MQDRKQISLWKLVTWHLRHDRTYILKWLKNLKGLPDVPGYCKNPFVCVRFRLFRLWHNCYLFVCKDGRAENVFSAAAAAVVISECSSNSLWFQTGGRLRLLLVGCLFTSLSVQLLYSKRQREPMLKSLPTQCCKRLLRRRVIQRRKGRCVWR